MTKRFIPVLAACLFLMVGTAQAATDEGRYIEVTGTSEVEIVPDEIHYIIEIKEYFAEEFDANPKRKITVRRYPWPG